MNRSVLVYLLVFFATVGLSSCQSSGGGTSSSPTAQCTAITSQYIVKLKSKVEATSLADRLESFHAKVGFENTVSKINSQFVVVNFRDVEKIQNKIAELKNSSEIEYAEPDVLVHVMETPNDPMFASQWAHQAIQSTKAWDITRGSSSVVVAMIDTGIDYTHPDLAANMWTNPGEVPNNQIDDDKNGYVDDYYGYNFADNNANPIADDLGSFHGTHTAGIVGAVGGNGIGVSGVSQTVKLMALKFIASNGAGQLSDAIRAIDYAIAMGAKVMSNSWGGAQGSQALSEAVARAQAAGILFVVAAGNGGNDGVGDDNDILPNYPSNYNYDNVIAVASTDQNDQLSTFSNYGVNTVNIAAPGENILSTKNGSTYQYLSGTSMSTPLVTGVLALMIAERPDLSYQQIRQILLGSVDQLPSLQGKISSGGRLNAYKALVNVKNGSVPTPTPPPANSSGGGGVQATPPPSC